MFRILGHGGTSNCESTSRREFLRIGTCGIGGLTLPALLAARANAANGNPVVRDKAVVVLTYEVAAVGTATAGDDFLEVAWFDPDGLPELAFEADLGRIQSSGTSQPGPGVS